MTAVNLTTKDDDLWLHLREVFSEAENLLWASDFDSGLMAFVSRLAVSIDIENERLKSIIGLMDDCSVEEATYTVDHYGTQA